MTRLSFIVTTVVFKDYLKNLVSIYASIVPKLSILGNFSPLKILKYNCLYYFLIEAGINIVPPSVSSTPLLSSFSYTYSSPGPAIEILIFKYAVISLKSVPSGFETATH